MKAKSLSKVTNLKENAASNIDSYAGYITSLKYFNIFFWFVTAEDTPEDKPLLVWLQVRRLQYSQ